MSDKPSADDIRNLRSSLEMIRFELRRLERRLETLEESAVEPDAPPTRAVEVPPSIEPPFISSIPITPPPVINPPPPRHETLDALRTVKGLPPVSIDPNVKSGTSAAIDAGEFEIAIGKTWLNRVGAFILLLGVGFFIKYAFDRGFISPAMRVVIGSATGLLLIAGGEYSIRNGMRPFAGGLLGAGTAILYFSVYGAYGFYQLITVTPAFVLLCCVTILSTLMSVRGRLLGIAILGVIGGFWTPIALSTGRNEQVVLLTYVAVLDLGFLACGLIRQWSALRILTFAGTALLFVGWYAEFYKPEAMWITLGFMAGFYVIYTIEVQLGVRRLVPNTLSTTTIVSSLSTAAFFGSVYYTAGETLDRWMGFFAVSLGAIQFLLARSLTRHGEPVRVLQDSMQIAGASLMALAAPLQWDKQFVVIAWGIQSVITFGFCRGHDRPWLRIKALAVLIAAVAHLCLYDTENARLMAKLVEFGRWYINWFFVLAIGLGLCAYAGAASLIIRRQCPKLDRNFVELLVTLGTGIILWEFHYAYENYLTTWCWMGLAGCWYAISLAIPGVRGVSLVIVGLVLFKYYSADTTLAAIDSNWNNIRGVVFNRQFITGIVVVILVLAAGRWAEKYLSVMPETSPLNELLRGRKLPPTVITVAAFTFLWAGSFEIVRVFSHEMLRHDFDDPSLAIQVGLSVFWSVTAIMLLSIGFMKMVSQLRYLAIAVFALTSVKVLLIDMANLDMIYRIVSFIVLGVLLLAASLLYQKLSERILKHAQA